MMQWPAIGELHRYEVGGVEAQFVAMRNCGIRVLEAASKEYGSADFEPSIAN
jgi:hypothetical protein